MQVDAGPRAADSGRHLHLVLGSAGNPEPDSVPQREVHAAVPAVGRSGRGRGGMNRSDREQLWSGLERTYREVRDFELMRLDVNRLMKRNGWSASSNVQGERQRPASVRRTACTTRSFVF